MLLEDQVKCHIQHAQTSGREESQANTETVQWKTTQKNIPIHPQENPFRINAEPKSIDFSIHGAYINSWSFWGRHPKITKLRSHYGLSVAFRTRNFQRPSVIEKNKIISVHSPKTCSKHFTKRSIAIFTSTTQVWLLLSPTGSWGQGVPKRSTSWARKAHAMILKGSQEINTKSALLTVFMMFRKRCPCKI